MKRALVLPMILLWAGTGAFAGESVPPGPPAASGLARSPAASAARAWREAHEVAIVRELVGLLGIPNQASDTADIERNAAAVSALYERRGATVRLLRVPDAPPAVYAALDTPGATKTVTFYAHYDGQPADPRQWTTPPFAPVLRRGTLESGGGELSLEDLAAPLDPEWRIYARSASDDKAPIVGFAAALDALKSRGLRPSVNLRFFFEGEEEAGSPHLATILERYAADLRTDGWILCDGPVHQSRRPQIFFGARGTTGLEMTVYGPNHGLHSGHYGNWAPNPIVRLAHLIDSMRDEEGRILVPGFADDVRPLSESETRAIAAVPRVDEALEKEFGIARPEGNGASLVELLHRPAVNVRGISAGHVGAQAANVIVPEATASIDFRLVPDQTPEGVRRKIESFIEKQGWWIVRQEPDAATRAAHPKIVKLDWEGGYPAARTSMDLPFSRAILAAAGRALGPDVVKMPMLGGSIPMYLFQDGGRIPVVGAPIANHDNNQHAANENLRLKNLWDGIELYATLFAEL
ncbi:MAG TPA: M20/M25/M40 family metallo-hydrolase [Thermoanaerobaculia bacterium]|nr:M20/M25/M40 family metallo-hydrolase [Thermoanaerobaculia bacterium]